MTRTKKATATPKKAAAPKKATASRRPSGPRPSRRKKSDVIVIDPPEALFAVGDTVRITDGRKEYDTGVVEDITVGEGLWPTVHVRTHKDGYLVRFNSNQLTLV